MAKKNETDYQVLLPEKAVNDSFTSTLGIHGYSGKLKNALDTNLEEMHYYFWEMKKEMEEKLGKDAGYNEHKDYLSDKYALTKTKEKYGYDTVMKQTYFKDIQESVDNRDDYLSECGEEIEDF